MDTLIAFTPALLLAAAFVGRATQDGRVLNVWTVRNGGIRFVRIGRLFFSFGVSRDVRPLGSKGE